MKYFAILAAVVAIGTLLATNMSSQSENDVLFQQFISEHGRNYATVEEYEMRKAIFDEQVKKAEEHNKQGKGWTMGVNQFSDWTAEEYQKLLGLRNFRNSNSNLPLAPLKASPENTADDWDWRNYPGFVGPVLNQGKCGSCWAFSAAQAVAGAYYRAFNISVDVARSHAVDCDFFSHGCNGGLQENAYVHWMHHPFITEKDYPYVAQDRVCQEDNIRSSMPLIKTGFRVDVGDDLLYQALRHQPVSISIRAENDGFRQYTGGIVDAASDCGVDIDHAVLLVGYNKHDNAWIVKNSWGDSWGENGYVRIAREGGKGICGINQQNSIPVFVDDWEPFIPTV